MLYKLFKRIYADRILEDIKNQFSYGIDIIEMKTYEYKEWDGSTVGGDSTSMSWETFCKNFKR